MIFFRALCVGRICEGNLLDGTAPFSFLDFGTRVLVLCPSSMSRPKNSSYVATHINPFKGHLIQYQVEKYFLDNGREERVFRYHKNYVRPN